MRQQYEDSRLLVVVVPAIHLREREQPPPHSHFVVQIRRVDGVVVGLVGEEGTALTDLLQDIVPNAIESVVHLPCQDAALLLVEKPPESEKDKGRPRLSLHQTNGLTL